MRTACGVGDMDDPEHASLCLECNRELWREYRYENAGPVRLWLRRVFEPKPLPLPPSKRDAVLDKGEPPKEEPMDASDDCQHPSEATYWNEYNGVIQCHACGAVTLAHTSADLVSELRRLVDEYGQRGVERVLATLAVLDKEEHG